VVIFVLALAVMAVVAMRNRVIFKMAVRNAPRRRAQTALIVVGLMLATLLFSASFTVGDTLNNSIRSEALTQIGMVDIMVQAETPDPSGHPAYFDEAYFNTVREGLAGVPEVAGVAPLATEVGPVVALNTGLNEPQVDILGYAEEWMSEFDPLESEQGNILSVSDLADDQVYISNELASELDVGTGDTANVYLVSEPADLEVAGVYTKGANPADELSLVMPLTQLQALMGNEGKINSIIITNQGDAIQGAEHTDAVMSSLEPLLEGSGLEAEPVKQDALDDADEAGSTFSTIFLLFGQFSIAAGILLIFLIFVMLAAERKRELGIARAVGAQQGHVIRMFAFEGAIYALVAAAVEA